MRRRATALAFAALAFAGCGGDEPTTAAPATTQPVTAAAASAVDEVAAGRATLLDVRTAKEFAAGHAAETLHLDHARIVKGALPDVPKDATVYVYCRSGRRAADAVRVLRAAGYRDVTNIGGLADWERAGGALARS